MLRAPMIKKGRTILVEQENNAIFGEVVPIPIGEAAPHIPVFSATVVRRNTHFLRISGDTNGLSVKDNANNVRLFNRAGVLFDCASGEKIRGGDVNSVRCIDALPEIDRFIIGQREEIVMVNIRKGHHLRLIARRRVQINALITERSMAHDVAPAIKICMEFDRAFRHHIG